MLHRGYATYPRCLQFQVLIRNFFVGSVMYKNIPLKVLGAKAETDDIKSDTMMVDFTMIIVKSSLIKL